MRTRKPTIGVPGWLTLIVGLFVVLALLPWVVLAALAALGVWLQRQGYVALDLSVLRKPWRGHESLWITATAFASCLIGIAIWGEVSGLSLAWLVSVAIVAGIFAAHSQGFAWPKEAKRYMDALDALKERLLLHVRTTQHTTYSTPHDDDRTWGPRTSRHTSYASEDSAMGDIDAMNGWAFETRMRQHFQALGWRVWKTPGTRDRGADLVLTTPDRRRVAAQLKRYSGPVGTSAVEQVLRAKVYYRADAALVVTNSHLTPGARDYARRHQVDVWEREELLGRLQDEQSERSYEEQSRSNQQSRGPQEDDTKQQKGQSGQQPAGGAGRAGNGLPECFRTLFFDTVNVTEEEITARFRKLSTITHPDVGGNHESFIHLQNAKDACLAFVKARRA